MAIDVQEIADKLREVRDHFDPQKVGGPEPELELTEDALYEAQETIEKLKKAKKQVAELMAVLNSTDLEAIEALLGKKELQKLAEYDREAVYEAKFREIDVGDEEKLAGQQEVAGNEADHQFQVTFHAAEETLKQLTAKIAPFLDALDAIA
jgi:uncharacterized protein YktB (UPF0637 family)